MPLPKSLFDESDGGFFFTERNADELIVRQKVASDSPLPSGNAIAAMVMVELGDRETAKRTLAIFANQLSQQGEGMSAMIGAAMEYVRQHGPLAVSRSENSSTDQPLAPEELAKQVVRIETDWINPSELNVNLIVLKPFHVNSHSPAKGMIATDLQVADAEVETIEYPAGEIYAGEVTIRVKFKQPIQSPLRISLRYQACDESACLPPVTQVIDVSV